MAFRQTFKELPAVAFGFDPRIEDHDSAGVGASVRLGEGTSEQLVRLVSQRRGVIVAGADSGPPQALRNLARALGWPLFADPRSGARGPNDAGVTVVHADAILRSPVLAAKLLPDVVIRFGAPWASKVLNQWLSKVPADILVDPHRAWLDPNRASSLNVPVMPEALCGDLAELVVPAPERWLAAWRIADAVSRTALADQLDRTDAEPDEPAIVRALTNAIPAGSSLLVSSSMPVRDLEWFAGDRSDVVVHANRGANGIDGVVSTALGVAAASDQPTFAVLGDLAFLHDAGALVLAAQHRANCTFLVIDNAGGGIFEFLPQATGVERRTFEALYGTPQQVDIASVTKAYGLPTSTPKTLRALRDALRKGAANDGVSVIVMHTDRRANVAVHDRLNMLVTNAVEAALRN